VTIVALSVVNAEDTFNYRGTSGDNYGPADWNKVSCRNLDDCPGWPDKHLGSIGWKLDENMCVWCPLTGNRCPSNHRMSPVDLVRDRAIEGHPNWKECPDWHWMNFEDGTCEWEDMKGHFEISPHALQIHMPMRNNGDIDCADSDGDRKFPRLDYSKGFPDWWHLDRTDIKVPSEHTQHGKRYAAEVSLAHFYEEGHYKNQIGYVTLFLQDYPGEKPWHYLDKLICEFRREEEKQRSECGLPPAPVYKMCELFRGQERTQEDFEFFEDDATTEDTFGSQTGQLSRPPPMPIQDFGGTPDAKHYPLQLCQGDCDFSEDCAPGLICHLRSANEAVPGCIGGEDLDGDSDFCVFDPFGPGYTPPTEAPTLSPTETSKPTIDPLPPKPLQDFGGTPPLAAFPLQRCQGDCDMDSDCATGLICHQRGSGEPVPGCSGGEEDIKLTDYCVLDPHGVGYDDPDVDTSSPSLPPTTLQPPPVAVPTVRPTSVPAVEDPAVSPVSVDSPAGGPKEVWNRGWEPAFKLDECEGDCDEDSDCLPGLVCFDRESSKVPVPGCAGGEDDNSLTDYCVKPELLQTVDGRDDANPTASPVVATTTPPTVAATTASPTDKPTRRPTSETQTTPSFPDDPLQLTAVGWSPPQDKKPLGLCEGDCDDDDDCQEGLVCFQRFLPMTAVPGCLGGESDTSLMDFCIKDPSVAPSETSKPNPAAPKPTEAQASAPSASAVVVPAVPTDSDIAVSRSEPPPAIDCQFYANQGVNLERICKQDEFACCRNPRSDSNYCHEVYDIFGDSIVSACHHCCQETERGQSLEVGPPNEPKPGLEPYTQCDTLDNTARICKAESCCDPGFAETAYCKEQWARHAGDVERICWYCCYPSKVFTGSSQRNLLSESKNNTRTWEKRHIIMLQDNKSHELLLKLEEEIDFNGITQEAELSPVSDDLPPLHTVMTKQEMRQYHKTNPRKIGPEDKLFEHPTMNRTLIVRKENFEPKGLKDEDAYFQELHSAFLQRELQTAYKENYEDVYWWPYEWLLKVGTEYYFRYEGSMTVPPCYTVNHWRVMKDPIRVAAHQIKELERLLAWRLDGKCRASTAGKPRDGNPDAVDVNRPLQEMKRGHRMVFCECQDWPSKFPLEREWCKKWQTRDPEFRLFDNPYNWPQNGF